MSSATPPWNGARRPEELSRQVSASESVRGVEAGRTFPVSVKGVTVQAGKVLLLENERAEWELPGGKLELGEDPADCVVREISEEAGWKVTAGPLLDCWQYHISQGRDVVIVTYGCHLIKSTFICGTKDDAREVIDHLMRYLAERRWS
jgi:8-oxo-dGTP pyrophosphatase MutT (NUDIX family)